MGIVDEFKKFDAELKNQNWSVSSINSHNELIVSLWGHRPLLHRHPTERKYIYTDNIDRWSGLGNKEFRVNLDRAAEENLKVRPILSTLKNLSDLEFIQQGQDASKFPKKFNAKTDWIGTLTKWDGVNFEFEFVLEQ